MRVSISERELVGLSESLGVPLRDPDLIRQALTHSSFGSERGIDDNERLEFLGDAVLKLVVSEELLQRFPEKDEGQLSRMRSYVVSGKALAKAAARYSIGDLLMLGRSAEVSGERTRLSVLADAMEALYGAVYLSCGFGTARRLILESLASEISQSMDPGLAIDYKSMLQEHLQGVFRQTPEYAIVESKGQDHNKEFTAEARANGRPIGVGRGASKKAASQQAAKDALVKLGIIDDGEDHS